MRKHLTKASYPHLMLEFRMLSALATIIANEHSDDDFTTTTRPDGAPTPTLRQTASEAMSGRRIHARTVASDPASVRYDRKTRQSRGSPWGLKPSKTAPCARISGQVCHLSTIMTH